MTHGEYDKCRRLGGEEEKIGADFEGMGNGRWKPGLFYGDWGVRLVARCKDARMMQGCSWMARRTYLSEDDRGTNEPTCDRSLRNKKGSLCAARIMSHESRITSETNTRYGSYSTYYLQHLYTTSQMPAIIPIQPGFHFSIFLASVPATDTNHDHQISHVLATVETFPN